MKQGQGSEKNNEREQLLLEIQEYILLFIELQEISKRKSENDNTCEEFVIELL